MLTLPVIAMVCVRQGRASSAVVAAIRHRVRPTAARRRGSRN
jgi:hypothetical protein